MWAQDPTACVQSCMLSHIQLCGTPWTVAHKDPLFMGFSRQEYCSELPFPSAIADRLLFNKLIKVSNGWWLDQPLFADMADNLYHSLSSSLPFDLICLASPIGFCGQERPGNSRCQGHPQAHRSGFSGSQETRDSREYLAQM